MADIQKRYIHQIFRNGVFLGNLKNIKSEFGYGWDINTAGVQLEIEVADVADHAHDAPDPIETEDGQPLQTESGETITTERQPDIVGNSNGGILIRNNNTIKVYEISTNYPNGKLVFQGFISKWRTTFGKTDSIFVTCLSAGQDLDNFLVQGLASTDVSHASQTTSVTIFEPSDGRSSYLRIGQKWQVGGGVTLLSGVTLRLAAANALFPQTATLKVWNNEADYYRGDAPIAKVLKTISSTTPADYLFGFLNQTAVTPGTSYFVSLTASDRYGIVVYYDNTDSYSGGNMWVSDSSYSSGVWTETGIYPSITFSDLYFKTHYTSGATSTTFSSADPTTTLQTIIDLYSNQGGAINYSAGTIDATGLTKTLTFKVNTILDAIKRVQSASPANYYWTVDPATNILYFKQSGTTADHTMVLGKHIESLDLEASVENVKNDVYFTGGDIGGNVNLFLHVSSLTALAANAGRVGLAKLVDNRVTQSDTASTIANSYLSTYQNEQYHTTLTINDGVYDTTLFRPGQIIGFGGFGNFIDALLLQIVRIDKSPDDVVLTVGVIPQRQSDQIEEIERRLEQVETLYNPSVPS